MKLFFRILFLFLSFNLTYAQSPTCETAAAMCSGNQGPFVNTTGVASFGSLGCLGSTPNPAWFYMQVGTSGTMNFQLSQTSNAGNGIDVDFILWGPFNTPINCNSLFGYSPGYIGANNVVACSYSTEAVENFTIPNAVAGQFYMLLVTNFSGSAGTYTLNQTGGSGALSCDIVCGIDLGPDQIFCSSTISDYDIVAEFNQAPTVTGSTTYSWYLFNGTSFVLQTTTLANTLNVNESGIWKVSAVRPGCVDLAEDEIEIRFDSPPNLNDAENLLAPDGLCTYTFDLTSVEADLLSPLLPENYVIRYYLDEEDSAIGNDNYIQNPTEFEVSATTTIYIRISNIGNEICAGSTEFNLVINCIPNSCLLDLTSAAATTEQTICIGDAVQNITYSFGDDATSVTVTGLPTGLATNISSGVLTISGTPTQTGTFNYEVETEGCTPSLTEEGTIIVSPIPTLTSLTSNTPICAGEDAVFTLEGTEGAEVSYTIDGGAVQTDTIDADGELVITITAPTADVTILLSNIAIGTCETSLTNTATVEVKPVPSLTALTSNTPICTGEDAVFTITGTANATVNYTLNDGTSTSIELNSSGTATITVTAATASQELTLSSIVLDGCSVDSTLSETVVVNVIPTLTSLTSNTPICAGEDAVFTLEGTEGAEVSYTIDGGAVQTDTIDADGELVITITAPTADVTILLSGMVLGSCSSTLTNTATVEVKPVPSLTALTSNTPICAGEDAEFTITGTANATVNYTLNDGTSTSIELNSSGTATITVTAATASQELTLSSIDLDGCSVDSTLSETVVVNVVPSLTSLTSNNPICAGEDAVFTLEGTEGAEVSYTIDGGAVQTDTIDADGELVITITAPTADVTILLSGMVLGSCSSTLTNTATVEVKPVPSLTALTSNTPICAGEDAVFTITGTANATVNYTLNDGTSTSIELNSSGTATITVTAATVSQELTLSSIDLDGCSVDSTLSETVVVNVVPSLTSLTSNNPICAGEDAVFTLEGTEGAEVSYTIDGGAVQTDTIDANGELVITITAPTADVTILLSGMVLGSCSSTLTNTATVEVKPIPDVTNLTSNSPICSGENAVFTITGSANGTVTYSINGATAATTPLNASGVGTVTISNVSTNLTINLLQISNGTCSKSLTLSESITVLTLPSITSITSNTPICPGEDAVFTINGTANATVSYTLNGVAATPIVLDTNGEKQIIVSNVVNNVTVTLSSITDGTCNASLTNSQTVTVNPLPSTPTIVALSETFCIGEEVKFNVSGGANDTVTYTVNGGANQTLVLNASGTGEIIITNPAMLIDVDLVSVTNGLCAKPITISDEAEVISCLIPKGISPGNDGNNDYWDLSGYNVKHVEIFNRYGTKVYSKSNYINEWKGQSENGNELPDGTYYYVIQFNQRPTETGWVYINREQ